MRRSVSMLMAALVLMVLSACTPVGQFLAAGGGEDSTAAPTASASPTPSPTPTPTPTVPPEPTSTDCEDAVLTDPGEYHLSDCVRVTVRGHDIQVNAGSIQTLVIEGDDNDIHAGDVGSLRVTGSVNDVGTLDAGSVDISGRFNQIDVHGSVQRVGINGDDNDVLADGDIGAVEDRGERNVVASTP
jgi:hypothetical protein